MRPRRPITRRGLLKARVLGRGLLGRRFGGRHFRVRRFFADIGFAIDHFAIAMLQRHGAIARAGLITRRWIVTAGPAAAAIAGIGAGGMALPIVPVGFATALAATRRTQPTETTIPPVLQETTVVSIRNRRRSHIPIRSRRKSNRKTHSRRLRTRRHHTNQNRNRRNRDGRYVRFRNSPVAIKHLDQNHNLVGTNRKTRSRSRLRNRWLHNRRSRSYHRRKSRSFHTRSRPCSYHPNWLPARYCKANRNIRSIRRSTARQATRRKVPWSSDNPPRNALAKQRPRDVWVGPENAASVALSDGRIGRIEKIVTCGIRDIFGCQRQNFRSLPGWEDSLLAAGFWQSRKASNGMLSPP